jgi:hypothetical protein
VDREAGGLSENKEQGLRGVLGEGDELLEFGAADGFACHRDVWESSGFKSLARA